jgi:hypothetical protein
MILGFNKHAWSKHNLFIKLGGDSMGFIGEILGKTKGLRFFFSFLIGLFFIMGFQWI